MDRYLFIYGTLLPRRAPAEIAGTVRRLRLMGRGTVRGKLYDLGEYPGAVLSRTARSEVRGQIFELPEDPAVLRSLDDYEGFDPGSPKASLFLREKWPVTMSDGTRLTCWVYTYNGKPGPEQAIASGRYVGRRGKTRKTVTRQRSTRKGS
jgi:gamma-glutamylcyclotransferase (GGCT)/AIG2-like uncharacterized protein YtfP